MILNFKHKLILTYLFVLMKFTARPPTAEIQEADNSSQAIKRRLPPEIKQKLAKVARFAVVNMTLPF